MGLLERVGRGMAWHGERRDSRFTLEWARQRADLTPALDLDVAFEVHLVFASRLLGFKLQPGACVDFAKDNRDFGGPLEYLDEIK